MVVGIVLVVIDKRCRPIVLVGGADISALMIDALGAVPI